MIRVFKKLLKSVRKRVNSLRKVFNSLCKLCDKSKILSKYRKFGGIRVVVHKDYLDFIRRNEVVRISISHLVYIMDIVDSFDYYFGAVEPESNGDFMVVDYSLPRYHRVKGYDRHPVFFSSFSEPLATTEQYMSFAKLKSGDVAIDLGAYSGLTSILYKDAVGPLGTVVAVDADEANILAISKNFENYENITGNKIELLYGAAWSHDDGIEFSTEGNMGSSAASIVGSRGSIKKVPSFTLSAIASKFSLNRVDFIKCDIEGAETEIFCDEEFFKKFAPRIIIEAHVVGGIETTDKIVKDLSVYGYKFKKVRQNGVSLPLIECFKESV